jgi:hypothetical protein
MSQEPIYTYRYTRKVRTGGNSCLSVACWATGILMFLFLFWPLGLLFFVVAYLLSAKSKYVSSCGYCGNEVTHTSVLCPICKADLAPEPKA